MKTLTHAQLEQLRAELPKPRPGTTRFVGVLRDGLGRDCIAVACCPAGGAAERHALTLPWMQLLDFTPAEGALDA